MQFCTKLIEKCAFLVTGINFIKIEVMSINNIMLMLRKRELSTVLQAVCRLSLFRLVRN